MRKLCATRSTGAGESQPKCSVAPVTRDTLVPRGQPEIASGLESQIELWLPSEQQTGKSLRAAGAKWFALA